uniref:Uncharacterized protein n=1 Tax=Lynx canadensis TaxID=61383 RepID=A0A667H1B5_LYNCA
MCIQRTERRKLRRSRPRSFQEKGEGEPSTERKEGYALAESCGSSHLANQQILSNQGRFPEGTVTARVHSSNSRPPCKAMCETGRCLRTKWPVTNGQRNPMTRKRDGGKRPGRKSIGQEAKALPTHVGRNGLK